ncbi:hypothetical protein DM860_007024 [Cuscuta australis]|uniref:TAF1C beta-propeller domain-containing protein n=1 Tax=Cuscuta australis TaxID=267555 RepID=A0A328E5W8_9ASTE|nr:hypothetical protein DM860_007024 [Cuscuta australis]
MEFSEDWKSLWPVSFSFCPPLLVPNKASSSSKRRCLEKSPSIPSIGPLIFNPCRETLIGLLNSPSLSPRLPPPYPDFTLHRFLFTSTTINHSTASSIASDMGPPLDPGHAHNYNALQLLPCPIQKDGDGDGDADARVLAFFPTGDNYDQIGFAMLTLNDSGSMSVREFKDGRDICVHSRRLYHRISRLLVNPVADFDVFSTSSHSGNCFGYIMACTMYSVHWFSVKMPEGGFESTLLDYLGHVGVKLFQGSAVVHACWSPHLSEECVVLLESGKLFLFDMSCWLKSGGNALNRQGKKLCVPWGDLIQNGKWVGCEFSWHPRILVVAHSSTVFLVDLRFDEHKVCTLLKVGFLSMGTCDRFVALSRPDSSGFCFAAASNSLLILCDVRKPSMPVLQWAHAIQNPEYITIFKLSKLRPIINDDDFQWASESGHCILLGSFWNCGFSIFFYGPPDGRRGPSVLSTACNAFYSWGLPSEFSLSGRDCFCGSCLMRGDLLKDLLPDWIDWKQKKDIVLGFGILDNDPNVNCNKSLGFSLIRLMSSGKLEAQRYTADWVFNNNACKEAHKLSKSGCTEDNFLYDDAGNSGELELRKHGYLKMDFLKEYLYGNLTMLVDRRQINLQKYAEQNQSKFHHEICENMKARGITALRSLQGIPAMIKTATFPTSFSEITMKSIWSSLPMNLLALTASSASSDGVDIFSDRNPYPFPFQKTPSSSEEVQSSSDAFVSPVLPTHFLIVLRNQGMEESDILPVDDEFQRECGKVMEEACAMQSAEPLNGKIASLADDTDDILNAVENLNILGIHRPTFSSGDAALEKSDEHKMYETFVYLKHGEEELIGGATLFDEGCPMELNFGSSNFDLTSKELDLFQQLKRQGMHFQKQFQLYQEYLNTELTS